eukprot:gene15200-21275_t
MIGSGNPSEGELRPQLLDRFGMSVNLGTMVDKEPHIQMVLDRLAYDKDPDAFCASAQPEQDAPKENPESLTLDPYTTVLSVRSSSQPEQDALKENSQPYTYLPSICAIAQPEQDALKEKVMKARNVLRKVKISMELQLLVSDICSRAGWVAGLEDDDEHCALCGASVSVARKHEKLGVRYDVEESSGGIAAKFVFTLIGFAVLGFSVVIGKFLFVDPDTRNLSMYDDDEEAQARQKAYHNHPVSAWFKAHGSGHKTFPVLFQNEFKPTKL